MKINLNKNDSIKLQKLIETKDINIEISEVLNSLCFDNEESLKDLFLQYDKLDNEIVKEVALPLIGLENEDKLVNRYLKNTFSTSSLEDYENNPYRKLFKNLNIKSGKYELTNLVYEPYTYFPLDEIKIYDDDFYREECSISLFKEKYEYLSLLKDNEIWMCITPNEINTMKPYIEKAKGKVLTFGLGLGYFAFMVSQKENVSKVTVVEKDKTIINLFKEHILPKFPNKSKIEIIESDCFEYLKNEKTHDYNMTFFDIWHNAEDGLPIYLKIMKTIGNDQNLYFWLEDSIICMLRRCFLILMEEQLKNFDDSKYQKAETPFDEIINDLYFKTKNLTFSNYNDIYQFLSKHNLKTIIK